MSLREELESAIELHGRIASNWEWEDTYNRACAELILDHGRALLDSIKDSDRLNFADASCWGNSYSSDGTRHDSVRESIDHDRARSKTVDGGGV